MIPWSSVVSSVLFLRSTVASSLSRSLSLFTRVACRAVFRRVVFVTGAGESVCERVSLREPLHFRATTLQSDFTSEPVYERMAYPCINTGHDQKSQYLGKEAWHGLAWAPSTGHRSRVGQWLGQGQKRQHLDMIPCEYEQNDRISSAGPHLTSESEEDPFIPIHEPRSMFMPYGNAPLLWEWIWIKERESMPHGHDRNGVLARIHTSTHGVWSEQREATHLQSRLVSGNEWEQRRGGQIRREESRSKERRVIDQHRQVSNIPPCLIHLETGIMEPCRHAHMNAHMNAHMDVFITNPSMDAWFILWSMQV